MNGLFIFYNLSCDTKIVLGNNRSLLVE